MSIHAANRRPVARIIPLLFSSLFLLNGCSDQSNEPTTGSPAPVTAPVPAPEPSPVIVAIESPSAHGAHQEAHSPDGSAVPSTDGGLVAGTKASGGTAAQGRADRIEAYRVVLAADETIRIPGTPGELRVWIGGQDYHPVFAEDMVEDETTVPAVGESATVQPFAPGFEIEPEETQCIRIHPSGSEVRFRLIPVEQGEFEVGADVFFFDSPSCTGSPIPKTAATLKVQVEVDPQKILIGKALQLWDILWEKFVEFWAAVVAIFFGVLLFLIRGRLKQWLGYEDK